MEWKEEWELGLEGDLGKYLWGQCLGKWHQTPDYLSPLSAFSGFLDLEPAPLNEGPFLFFLPFSFIEKSNTSPLWADLSHTGSSNHSLSPYLVTDPSCFLSLPYQHHLESTDRMEIISFWCSWYTVVPPTTSHPEGRRDDGGVSCSSIVWAYASALPHASHRRLPPLLALSIDRKPSVIGGDISPCTWDRSTRQENSIQDKLGRAMGASIMPVT